MQVNGVPNKFEIFQEFYYDVNGIVISYNQAVKLFYQMDSETENSFVEYYADEVGYELVQKTDAESGEFLFDDKGNPIYENVPFVAPSGYNLDGNSKKHFIEQKYSIQAYAAKNGLILDPEWSVYSAEEIMQMFNNGVNIPQDIVDVAQTMLQSDAANLEGAAGESEENAGNETEVTEQETFLELIPKAKKHIEKSNEKAEKIDEKVQELIDETQVGQNDINSKIEDQKATLDEYEEMIREWRTLQNKVNNG
jgi:hypothetical protein